MTKTFTQTYILKPKNLNLGNFHETKKPKTTHQNGRRA